MAMFATVAGTGHRPDKLGGYDEAVTARLVALAVAWLEKNRPTTVISGMALGWDTALAMAAVMQDVPFIAAVPFHGQECMWPARSQQRYGKLLHAAQKVVVVSDGGYAAWKMQHRNTWMVDHCDTILALWNGTSGGTANCVQYAKSIRRPVINLWSEWRH